MFESSNKRTTTLFKLIVESELSARLFFLHNYIFPVLKRHNLMNGLELEGYAELILDRESSDFCWPRLLCSYNYALSLENNNANA